MNIKIEKLVAGGGGLGFLEGKPIFVPFSAPGDVLDVEITADHGNYAEAKIVSIIEGASCRVTPRCKVFGECGGCQWQHISYEAQLEWKCEIVKEALRRIAKIAEPQVEETIASPKEWNWRNRIQLHVNSKGRVGFYKPKSKNVVEFDECPIADERINRQLNEQRKEISKRDRGIAIRVEDSDASFMQVNTEQNKNLRRKIAEWLSATEHENVLELFCGSGNFTFDIAKTAKHVVASDIDHRAIDEAKQKQFKAGAGNIEFICADAAKTAKKYSKGFDAIVLDPPRKGCAEAIAPIVKIAPKNIFYISCDPATLSRDILELKKHGYEFLKAVPLDMFPQTFHVETLVHLLSRND